MLQLARFHFNESSSKTTNSLKHLDSATTQTGEENALDCHSGRSEESLFDRSMGKKPGGILRFAQNDSVLSFSTACKHEPQGRRHRRSSRGDGKLAVRLLACVPSGNAESRNTVPSPGKHSDGAHPKECRKCGGRLARRPATRRRAAHPRRDLPGRSAKPGRRTSRHDSLLLPGPFHSVPRR